MRSSDWSSDVCSSDLAADEGQGDVAVGSSGATSVARAMRTPHFIVLAIVFFCCCATHAGPIFHTVSYAIGCGLPTMAAVTIYSVEGSGGLGGRVLFGVPADHLGLKTAPDRKSDVEGKTV